MGTIADKLSYLTQTKGLIKEAIEEKGVAVPEGTAFREYAGLIRAIGSVEKYFYNGVELPPVPKDYAEEYPYAVIVERYPWRDAASREYMIFLSDSPIWRSLYNNSRGEPMNNLRTAGSCVHSSQYTNNNQAYLLENGWYISGSTFTGGFGTILIDGHEEEQNGTYSYRVLWANHDIFDVIDRTTSYEPTGELYFPKSADPTLDCECGGVTVYHFDGTYADFIANRETLDLGGGALMCKVSDDVLTESDLAFRELIFRTSEHPSKESYDGEKYWRHCPLELFMKDGIFMANATVFFDSGSAVELTVMVSIPDEAASALGISAGTYMFPFLYPYEWAETPELCKFEFYFMYGSAVNEL